MKKLTAIILIVYAFFAGCALTFAIGYSTYKPATGLEGKTREVYELLDKYYIGDIDQTELEDMTAAGMVCATGDRWSYYLPASDYDDLFNQQTNSYVGIGVTVKTLDSGNLQIETLAPGGPAQKAGLQVGDVLTAVDGIQCKDHTLSEMQGLITGVENTEVTLTFQRGGKKKKLTVLRQRIENQVVSSEMIGNVGYIKIDNFEDTCAKKSIAAIEDVIYSGGATALLFDVRNNPGGYQRELVQVLDYLLPEGILFQSVDYRGKTDVDYSDSACVHLPMAVLINEDTYSAAEFFAAALEEYGVGVTVGGHTCGKGYYQVAFNLTDGSVVNLSIGKYFTPMGVSLAEVGGLEPNYPVELTEEEYIDLASGALKHEDDPQLQKALSLLQETP